MKTPWIAIALVVASAGIELDAKAGESGFGDPWRQYGKVWQGGKASYLVDIDNDSLLLQDKDGLYTSGAQVQVQSVMRDTSGVFLAGWRLGQQLYTPTDVKIPPPQLNRNEHPYAGWLYTGWFAHALRRDGSYVKSGFDIGCIGPCAGGEATQRNLHKILNQPLPVGWASQVNNELGVQGEVEWAPASVVLGTHAELTPSLHGRLGNIFTDAGLGATFRFGNISHLPQEKTAHLMLRFDAKAVGYNATLQGGYFSKDNPRTVAPKRVVGEVELGWIWQGEQFGALASIVRRSNEIRDFPNSQGAQNFARFQFSYTPQ